MLQLFLIGIVPTFELASGRPQQRSLSARRTFDNQLHPIIALYALFLSPPSCVNWRSELLAVALATPVCFPCSLSLRALDTIEVHTKLLLSVHKHTRTHTEWKYSTSSIMTPRGLRRSSPLLAFSSCYPAKSLSRARIHTPGKL